MTPNSYQLVCPQTPRRSLVRGNSPWVSSVSVVMGWKNYHPLLSTTLSHVYPKPLCPKHPAEQVVTQRREPRLLIIAILQTAPWLLIVIRIFIFYSYFRVLLILLVLSLLLLVLITVIVKVSCIILIALFLLCFFVLIIPCTTTLILISTSIGTSKSIMITSRHPDLFVAVL